MSARGGKLLDVLGAVVKRIHLSYAHNGRGTARKGEVTNLNNRKESLPRRGSPLRLDGGTRERKGNT